MKVSGELCIFSSCINSSNVGDVSSGTCQRSIQTSSSGTMLDEGSWGATVLNMLQDIPHWSHYKRSRHRCFGRPGAQSGNCCG